MKKLNHSFEFWSKKEKRAVAGAVLFITFHKPLFSDNLEDCLSIKESVSDFKRFVSRKCRNGEEVEKEIKSLRSSGQFCPDVEDKELKKDIERGLELLLLVMEIRTFSKHPRLPKGSVSPMSSPSPLASPRKLV